LIACLFFVGLYLFLGWHPYLVWLLGSSLFLFMLYGYDKAQAVYNGSRVPEIALHLLAIFGGFFGGWLGMVVFRHKKNNVMFLVILLGSTVLHGYIVLKLFPDWLGSFEILRF